MRAQFTGALASAQFLFLLAKGVATLFGYPMSWFVVLIPLWTLLGIAVLFWIVLGSIVRALG